MVNSMVERATSDMLIGPDWAMNIEICDICNHDPVQAKDVVKGIKKRIGSKNSKVQLLALTLLETMIKNCGDILHMHVAEKDVLHDMVKIVRKKPDLRVKEKILILIDTWQEAFGGPRGRYPQYYAAYQELLRMGAVFPQRSERSSPVVTPLQSHPLTSYPQNLRNAESSQDAADSSGEAEFPTLSLTEIQNARGIMDVLAEMLSALDPGNKEGLRQDVLVDLVEQCRTYKQRVVHLVNSTSDESLLCQGLSLNDDLQRVLAKHEAISSRNSMQPEKPKPEPVQQLVDVGAPLIDTGDDKQPDTGSAPGSDLGSQLLLPAPPATNSSATTPTKADQRMDLLSGDDFNSPKSENSLALVPVGEAQPASPVTQQNANALALVDMFSQTSNAQSAFPMGQTYHSSPPLQQQQNLQSPEPLLYPNGGIANTMLPQYEQPSYVPGSSTTLNIQIAQQQQPPSPGAQNNLSFPRPPWEDESTDNSQFAGSQHPQPLQVTQVVITHSQQSPSGAYPQGAQPPFSEQFGSTYIQPTTDGHISAVGNQALQNNQLTGFHPQNIQGGHPMGMFQQPSIQPGQMAYMYPQQMYGNQMAGYGYGYMQQQNAHQYIQQKMSGLSMRDDGSLQNTSYRGSTPYVHVPSGKPSKPEDKLFGDLVDITKFKSPGGRAGSM